jgi:hypothetical protein
MKKLLIIAIAALTLSGCATHGQYIERMDAHKGLHIDTVVRSFGPPHRVHNFENGQASYEWIDYGESGSVSIPLTFGNSYYPATYMNFPYSSYCSTIFYANEMGFTTNYTWSGNGCTWYEPGPVEFNEEELENTNY